MYVYEFLWRGRPNGEPAYHVILAEEKDIFGKQQHIESDALTPEQAEAHGFPLAAIIKGINAAALVARDRALAERAAMEIGRDNALSELMKADPMAAERAVNLRQAKAKVART